MIAFQLPTAADFTLVGTAAARPAAATVPDHTVYVASDTGAISIAHASAWVSAGGGAAAAMVDARLRNSVDISCSSGGWTELTFDTEDTDASGFHSASTGRLIVPVGTGPYVATLAAMAQFAVNASGDRGLRIRLTRAIGGVTVTLAEPLDHASSTDDHIIEAVAAAVTLRSLDQVFVEAYHNSGSPLNVRASSEFSPVLSMTGHA